MFRRNCFENNFAVVLGDQLAVNCVVNKEGNAKVRLEVSFTNQSSGVLEIGVVYKVPQCYSIEKRSKISKRFQLKNSIRHVFCLGVE